jgi:uncharacterized membrane protein YtjA (UPF0391 family)
MLDTKKTIIKYLSASLFCIIVNFIYAKFSHNVSSNYMTFMFLIPLIGLLLSFISQKITYHNFLASSILTLTLTSFLKGIVEIAGTSTLYINFLFYISLILLIISLLSIFCKHRVKR